MTSTDNTAPSMSGSSPNPRARHAGSGERIDHRVCQHGGFFTLVREPTLNGGLPGSTDRLKAVPSGWVFVSRRFADWTLPVRLVRASAVLLTPEIMASPTSATTGAAVITSPATRPPINALRQWTS